MRGAAATLSIMNVEPELLDHPKFLRLEKRVGAGALKALLRLWGHCAANKRGERWAQADPEYLECVARWEGDTGQLYTALVDIGWVEETPEGLVIHDWEENNSFTVLNWSRSPNGRKGNKAKESSHEARTNPPQAADESKGNPRINHGQSKDQSETKPLRVNDGDEGNDKSEGNEGGEGSPPVASPPKQNPCQWPSREEWMAAAAMEGLAAIVAQSEWDNQERKVPAERWRGIDPRRLRHHAAFVLGQWRLRRAKKNPAALQGTGPVDEGEMKDLVKP